MCDVKLLCNKSFSEADQEIIGCFVDFLKALVSKDLDVLNGMAGDCDEFINLMGSQSNEEFISSVDNDELKFFTCEILDPTILFDDENTASLIGKVRLTVEINGKELRLITDSVVSFQKIDEEWHIMKWDS